MVGESGELSERVKRTLPQSFFGRAMLTWFNPGPATGYLFAIANLLAVLVLGCFTLTIGRMLIDPQNAWLNAEFMRKFESKGQHITLERGASTAMQLVALPREQ